MAIPAGLQKSWKLRVRTDIAVYKDFPGQPLKSIGHFDRMVDLAFLPVNSQEGVVEGQLPADPALWRAASCDAAEYKRRGGKLMPRSSGPEYTERAYVSGFVPRRLASRVWYFANLTDKVCIVGNYGIPVTYGSCFDPDPHPVVPADLPYPATRLSAADDAAGLDGMLKWLRKEGGEPYTHIQFFDPTHGRPARTHLYPDVVKCLKKSAASAADATGTRSA
jgi:hypothetical protein